MDRLQRQRRIERALRTIAFRLIANKQKQYPYGTVLCLVDGEPCCAFGEVLKEASPTPPNGPRMFPELQGMTFVSNQEALATALGVEHVPDHVGESLRSISDANDNSTYTHRQKRCEVADRLFYAADVLAYAEIGGPAEAAA